MGKEATQSVETEETQPMETEMDKKFRKKVEAYDRAVKIAQAIIKSEKYVNNSDVKSMLENIVTNRDSLDADYQGLNEGTTEEQKIQKWSNWEKNRALYVGTKNRNENIRKFFEKLPDNVVKSKEFEDFYDACIETIGEKEQIKQREAMQELKEKEEQIKMAIKPLINLWKVKLGTTHITFNMIDTLIVKEEQKLEENKKSGASKEEIQNQETWIESEKKLRDYFFKYEKQTMELKEEMKKLPSEKVVKQNEIINMANTYGVLLDAFAEGHNNSEECEMMANAIKMVREWDDKTMQERRANGEKVPETLEQAVENLQKAAENYLAEKNKQYRPFPSKLRKNRMALVKSLIKQTKEKQKELKELSIDKIVEKQQTMKQTTPQKDTSELVIK